MDFFRSYGTKLLCAVLGVVSYFFLHFWLAPYLGFVGTFLRFCLGITTAVGTHMARLLVFALEKNSVSVISLLQIWLVIIPYVLALHLFWTTNTLYRRQLVIAAVPLWVLLGFYAYYVLDELAVPVVLFLTVTVVVGYFSSNSGDVDNRTKSSTTVKRTVIPPPLQIHGNSA